MSSAATNTTAQAPNIVFILADDLGWADLGVYGQTGFATPYLDALAGEGVRLGCVTNKAGAAAWRLLERCGLASRLSLLVAGDTLAQRKPDGAVLRHAAEALGVPVARLAHVGDSRTDVQAARNAGAVAWAVPYGYDGGEPVALARPDALFPGLPALAAHLIALRQAERAGCRGDGHADAGR